MAKQTEPTGIENFTQAKALLESVTADAEKCFSKGNKSAGVRVRKTMQEVKALFGIIRKQSLEVKEVKE